MHQRRGKTFLGNKSLAFFGTIFFLFLIVFATHQLDNTLNNKKINDSIIKDFTISQLVSVAGQPLKWVKTITVSSVNTERHFLHLPGTASSVKLSVLKPNDVGKAITNLTNKKELTNADRFRLSQLSLESSKSEESVALAKTLEINKSGFLVRFFYSTKNLIDTMFAAAGEALGLGDATTTEIALIDLTASSSPIAEQIVVTPEATSTEVSTTTETLPVVTEVTPIEATTTEVSTTTEVVEPQPSPSSDVVTVVYETPAPTIAEAETETGKVVTVSAIDTPDAPPITNVLAYTNIPEIYKVGQEDKIKIKWTNNNDQEVTFHAYDLNGNGKLDYVEWTVPHLSTQTFEIIFISKAFQLDTDKTILSDIYDQVKNQDDVWATIDDGQYVRVTFERVLSNRNDNTIYALPNTASASIEVYPVYTDELGNITEGPLVATFSNIDHKGYYKVLLTNLQTPTDVFDLKVAGNINIDYIVDPSPLTISDTFSDSSKIATSTNLTVSGGQVYLSTSATAPGAPLSVYPLPNSSQNINLYWAAPSSNGGSSITNYKIYRSTSSGFTPAPGDLVATVSYTPTSYSDTGLTDGTVYYYKLTAVNAIGEGTASTQSIAYPGATKVFVTSTTYNGNFGGLSGGDGICAARATAAGLSGTWKAWLSDTTTDASSRLYHNTLPYTNMHGVKIANNWAGVTGFGLLSAISYNESRNTASSFLAWTGTEYTGLHYFTNNCVGWASSTASGANAGVNGQTSSNSTNWTNTGTGSCNSSNALYCFEQAVTVPGAPTIGTATAGNAQASVTFSAPGSNGGSAITAYTVTSSPGGFTGTGAGSPITVTGLSNGTAYTFTVTATNAVGTSSASSASNSVTPSAPVGSTQSFAYTGSQQTFVVPTGVTSITVDAVGSGTTYAGGGRTQGNITVTSGETIYLYPGVGAGGGSGYESGAASTDIRRGGTALADRVIVAGGAGGTGSEDGVDAWAGGSGGGTNGSTGTSYGGNGGGGGTQSSGGTAGSGGGSAGSLGTGGAGAGENGGGQGGGGGGGYYGGGGGGMSNNGGYNSGGGGGGGSALVPAGGSTTAGYGGTNSNGYINLSWTYPNPYTISTASTFSFVVPTGITSLTIDLRGPGGGGGGGGDEWGDYCGAGAGGGGGITAGGGVGGSGCGTDACGGTAGTNSYIKRGGTTLAQAAIGAGGHGGVGYYDGGGAGGSAGTNIYSGLSLTSSAGGAGGSAGTDNIGGSGQVAGSAGDKVTGSLSVTPGEILDVRVGAVAGGGIYACLGSGATSGGSGSAGYVRISW